MTGRAPACLLVVVAALAGACAGGDDDPGDGGASEAGRGDGPLDGRALGDGGGVAADGGAADGGGVGDLAGGGTADVPPGVDVPADQDGPDAPAGGADGGAADGPAGRRNHAPLFHTVRFLPTVALRTSAYTSGAVVAIGDLNGDGRQDVALGQDRESIVGGQGVRLSVFLQGADGNLAAPRTTTLPVDTFSTPTALAVLDLNGDGRQDLVMANRAAGLLMFNQTAGGDLAPPVAVATRSTETSGEPLRLATGHFDGDQRLDVVAATSSGSLNGGTYQDLLFYLQQPTGGLAPARPQVLLRTTHAALAVGDLDGNGRTDVAVASDSIFGSGKLGVLLQTGPGTWSDPIPHFLASSGFGGRVHLMIGDATDDGRQDLVAAYGDTAGWLAVLRQAADGSRLGPPELTPVAGGSRGVCLADIDGDNRQDVVVLHASPPTVGVLLQRPGGGFEPEDLYRVRGQVDNAQLPLACGDVNGDGRPDVVIIHSAGLELLLNRRSAADSQACGESGQPCCGDERCGAGAFCGPLKLCLPCGAAGQPCCDGSCRDPGTHCRNPSFARGTCAPCPADRFCDDCGQPGQRCCASPARPCASDQAICVGDPGSQGQCQSCGGPGQPCCAGSSCRDQGCCFRGQCVAAGSACGRTPEQAGVCRSGTCDGCGQPGHACCLPQPPNNQQPPQHGTCASATQACDSLDSYFVSFGFCADCGGTGQPCCGGNVCAGGGCCQNNVCIAAGTACQDMNGTCAAGSCGACGGPDQPCCNGIRCTAAGTTCRRDSGTTGEYRCRTCGERGQPCCAGGCRTGLTCGRGWLCE